MIWELADTGRFLDHVGIESALRDAHIYSGAVKSALSVPGVRELIKERCQAARARCNA